MKNLFKYFLYSLIFLIVSCADEGPFEVGQFDIQTEVDQVTATTAIVKVKVPESKKQLLKEFNNLLLNGEYSWDNDYHNDMYSVSATEKHFLLTNLKPSTTYEVSITGNTKESDHYNWITINTTQKFTTSQAGDYNALNLMASSEIIRKIGNVVWVKISLPEKLDFSNQNEKRSLLFSKSQDMADPSVTDVQRGWEDGGEYFYAVLEGVEDGMEYYLKLTGDFTYTFPEFGLQEIIDLTGLKEIGFDRPLAITGESIGDGLSANLLMTKRYSLSNDDNRVAGWIKLELPDGMEFIRVNEEYKISWSETHEFSETTPNTTYISYSWDNTLMIMCDNLEIGKSYYFKIEGNFRCNLENIGNYEGITSIISSPLKIVEKENNMFACELVMATRTMTLVKIKLPENITFASGAHKIYWRNLDNTVSAWESQTIEDYYIANGQTEVNVSLPALTPNEKGYQFSMDGNFNFEELGNTTISTILYSANNLMISLNEQVSSACSLEFYYGNEAVVNFQLADNLRFDGKGTVIMNTTEDFSGQSVNTEYPYSTTSNFRIQLKGLNSSDTYYFRLKGDFIKEENGTTNRLQDEIIDVKGSIKLSGNEKTIAPGTCELVTSGDNFNIVRLKFPQKISFSGATPYIYYNESEHFNIEDLTTTNAIASLSKYEIAGNLPKLEVGKTYYFKTQTDVYYDENFLFKDVIIPYSGSVTRPQMDINKANYETVFDCKDFTALKLNMPKGIEMGSSIKLKYSSDNDPISVNGTTMFFKSLNPATYNLSINGDAFYRDNNFHIRLDRINMEIAEPFTPTPGDKYLIDVTLFKDGSKECIALTRGSELVKFNINTSAAWIKTLESNEINLENKNQTDGRLTYEIPANYTLIEGKEYTIRYYAQIEFIDKEKYGDAYYNLNASYSLVYSSTETKGGTRSTLESRRLTKLKSASISSLSKNKSPRKTTRRNKTAVKKTTAKR